MDNIVWLAIMIPCSALFTIIGIFARNRKKPMWFWSNTAVRETEIADIKAYNRANGRMWLIFSLPLWLAALLGLWNGIIALVLIAAECVVGLPILARVYKRIYEKYKA